MLAHIGIDFEIILFSMSLLLVSLRAPTLGMNTKKSWIHSL